MMETRDFQWRWAHVDWSDGASDYEAQTNRLRPDDDRAKFPITMERIDAQPGERMLEMGCGNGAGDRAVARNAQAIRGVVTLDASAAMVGEDHRRGGGGLPVSLSLGCAHHMPFPDGTFDRSHTMETFVTPPDTHQALRELMRVTQPS